MSNFHIEILTTTDKIIVFVENSFLRKVGNFTFEVEISGSTKVTSLWKIALKRSKINEIT